MMLAVIPNSKITLETESYKAVVPVFLKLEEDNNTLVVRVFKIQFKVLKYNFE